MKYLLYILLSVCPVFVFAQSTEKNDNEEKTGYEAIVFDPGFDLFLTTQPSKSFYSEPFLKTKNTLMVAEWNYRVNNPMRYRRDIYEIKIDYDPNIEYGIDVEYTLYMFFRFMEKENHISLL